MGKHFSHERTITLCAYKKRQIAIFYLQIILNHYSKKKIDRNFKLRRQHSELFHL